MSRSTETEYIAQLSREVNAGDAAVSALQEVVRQCSARIAELEKDKVRLEVERNCAVAALQMAPQAPPTNQYCPDWVDSYRVWWIRRLPGTGELIDAAMNQATQGRGEDMKDAVYFRRVTFGSHEAEYYLYDTAGTYMRYWSVYHDGELPVNLMPLGEEKTK